MSKVKLPQYDYPKKYSDHMLAVPDLAKLPKTDENYPYINKNIFFRILSALIYFCVITIVHLILIIALGLRIHNRKILRQYKKELKNGAITICNHVHMWDYLCVLLAIRPHRQYHAAWLTNLKGPNRHLIRLIGGIPVPTNYVGLKKFDEAVDEVIVSKKWFHLFAEGSLWFHYDKIRPFKKGAFTYAVRHNVPVLPLVISYRERKGWTRIFSKKPLLDITICPPSMPDTTLPKNQAVNTLLNQCRTKMQVASGFEETIDQEATCRPDDPQESPN